MADNPGYEINKAVQMDYAEHERTYGRFLQLLKLGIIWVVAILLGMIVALMTTAGAIAGLATFIIFGAGVTYLAR